MNLSYALAISEIRKLFIIPKCPPKSESVKARTESSYTTLIPRSQIQPADVAGDAEANEGVHLLRVQVVVHQEGELQDALPLLRLVAVQHVRPLRGANLVTGSSCVRRVQAA